MARRHSSMGFGALISKHPFKVIALSIAAMAGWVFFGQMLDTTSLIAKYVYPPAANNDYIAGWIALALLLVLIGLFWFLGYLRKKDILKVFSR